MTIDTKTAAGAAAGFLAKALPWISAAAGGNVPALVALAAKAVGDAVGAPVEAHPEAVAAAVAGATPEQIAQLKQADSDLQAKLQALGFQHAEEMARLGIEEAQLATSDVQDARRANSGNEQLWRIAWVVLVTFALVMSGVLWGCYSMLSGNVTIKDVAVVAAIAGLVGSIVGYVAANAQTVINFLFGGSLGSRSNGAALGAAVQQSIQQLGKG